MRTLTLALSVLLIATLALSGCGSQAQSSPTPVPEPTATTAPTATPQPTATPTTEPTATSTATPVPSPTPTPEPTATPTATPVPAVSLTDDEYRNNVLGVVWQRPDAQWEFVDTSDLVGYFGTLTPLVTLMQEPSELYVTLLTLDLSDDQLRALADLMVSDPEEGLAAIASGMGDAGDLAELTELGANTAIVVPVATEEGGVNFMWIVVRPQGVVYALAEGFATIGDAAVTLEQLSFSAAPAAADLSPEEQRAQLIAQVEGLRGLQTLQEVAVEYLPRDDLRAKLESKAAENIDPAEAAAVDQLLKLLGLIPPDADWLQLQLDLLESQLAGFYDPDTGAFYLLDSARDELLSPLDQATFVHEYVHALQDQHFDLSRLTDDNAGLNEDQQGALRSLAEGDASLLMGLWAATYLSPDQLEEIVAAAGELDPEALANAPAYLRGALTFPYEYGAAFARAIVAALGWEALDEIWRNPPPSTEQIVHPERYGQDEPIEVTLPSNLARALGAGWQEALRDVWGEADLILLLQEALDDDAFTAADGWNGSQYVFLVGPASRGLFAIEVAWDSAAEAREGGQGIADWLAASGFSGQAANFTASDGRSAFLRTAGDRTYLALGNAQADLRALLAALQW